MLKKMLRAASLGRKANHLKQSESIFSNIFSLIKWDEAPTIAGYWPLIGEIDDLTFLEYCHERGLKCGLPFITNTDSPLTFKTWQPCDLLEPVMYGIPSPSPHAIDLTPDILLFLLLLLIKAAIDSAKGAGFMIEHLKLYEKNTQF
jgi:5-formyltetrahydrofolate cyclo-ligase